MTAPIRPDDCSVGGPEDNDIAMSPQQRRFSSRGLSRLDTYRELIVAEKSWLSLLGFECYNLFLSGLAGLPGMAARSLILPLFCRRFGTGSVCGRGVTLRQPCRISIGKSVVIDEYAVLDVRSPKEQFAEAGIQIGDHALIGRGSIISSKGGIIRLGSACNISSGCRIATRSGIEIGESVLIAAYVYIGCGNHRFEKLDQPIIEQEMEVRGGVKIGSNSWIGTRATILDGVTIGRNAVIGAHSLVREDVPDNAIAAGSPARILRFRTDEQTPGPSADQ
ncbi:MAG TPA: acyltransferase [Oligoflexia bacterium]|nr:acyltransferase [Oligoflexia bacterium]